MDPYNIISQFGSCQALGNGLSAFSVSQGGFTQGLIQGDYGSEMFSFTDTPLGSIFRLGGKIFALRPDYISRLPFGQSFSVFSYGAAQSCGSIGFGPTSGYFSQNLGPNLGLSMTASMMSSGSTCGNW